VPDFDHGVRDGVAGLHVDDLGIEDQLYALLGLGDVLADIFSADVWGWLVRGRCRVVVEELTVGTLSNFWAENTRVVAREKSCLVGRGVIVGGRQMACVGNGCCITSLQEWDIYQC
jgi:hypothetical protein